MQQSKAYVIKNAARNLRATINARKAEYALYRYGSRKVSTTREERCAERKGR
jgi:hypothetical protein